jgi:type III restriction enzyme
MTVDGKTVKADLKGKERSFDEFWEDADVAVIDDAYRRAARVLSPDIARSYVEHLAQKIASIDDDPEEYLEAITEARVTVAGLGLVTEIGAYFDAKADEVAKTFLQTYSTQIKAQSDDRKESYRQIIEMSTEPQSVDLAKPESRYEATKAIVKGNTSNFPTWKNHLLCDKEGKYPAELNDWERTVVEVEAKRTGFQFWYRNPQQPGQSSLGVAYLEDDEYKIVRPDFVFFAEQDGKLVADIVDPHGIHLADALPKLKGLAEYAKAHASSYRRIESVAQVGGKLRVLDLTRPEVQTAIKGATNATALYEGVLANDYD